jgi:hypothetical protein
MVRGVARWILHRTFLRTIQLLHVHRRPDEKSMALLESKTAGSFPAAVAADIHVVLSRWRVAWPARRGRREPENLVAFFTQLGYDPDTLHLEGITPPVVNVKDYYRQLPSQPDIVMRIEKAIGASGSLAHDDSNAAYLADVAALVAKTPGWCERIPEDLPLRGQPAGFRDWCLFTLASNTRNPELCRLIPIRDIKTDPRLSLRANCGLQARSRYPGGQYGPEVPDTDDRTSAVIAMLRYQIPRAKDLPLADVYAAYERFLHEMNRGTDPRHTAARQRFITRVRAPRPHRS